MGIGKTKGKVGTGRVAKYEYQYRSADQINFIASAISLIEHGLLI